MSTIKWIKITTDIFDDEKIKLIDTMPDRDALIVIWFKLLALAGKQNESGLIFLSNKMPYTDEMLATIFNRPINTLRLALKTFQNFDMIEINENQVISISNWEKHQNIDGMDKIKEQNRIRQAEYRKKQKLMLENKSNVTSRDSNAVDKNRIDKEKEKNISSPKKLSKLDDIKIKINELEISDKLKQSLIEFAEYRKEIKKEVTFRSIKMTVKNLLDNKKYTSEEHLISSIENSISQGYTGIFPVEDKIEDKKTRYDNIV